MRTEEHSGASRPLSFFNVLPYQIIKARYALSIFFSAYLRELSPLFADFFFIRITSPQTAFNALSSHANDTT